MQIKGPRKIGISPEKGQDGWKFLMNMKEKGEDVAQAAVVLGTDPIVFAMSSSKTARSGQDELEIAGGFKGKPVEVVKCENSDILVPANVEMIIEGEIPLNDLEKEGPFGEMYGYMGLPHEEQFYMNIKTITHRVNPMIVNQFTGVTRGYITTPGEAASLRGFSKFMPELRGFHIPIDHVGFLFLSIEKTKPHQAIELAEKFNFLPLGKIVIVVDEDVDIHNTKEVFQTVGARWQPYPGAKLIEDGPGFFLDPSAKTRGKSSRILIDATRQLPEENGPSPYPKLNKEHLVEHAPEIFALVEEKWGHLI
jgi:UbiD family decarboxylase